MKERMSKIAWATILIIILLTSGLALAGGGYEIAWFSVDGGGGHSEGGSYGISGTVGQPDANWSEAGSYSVQGGFWQRSPMTVHRTYLPLVIN